MQPIRPSQARPGNRAARETPANATQQIPSTNFRRHFAIADGDCLFRSVHMDLSNRPGVQASNQEVMGLRQAAANYVAEHRQALIAHPSFDGEAGVNNLYGLLITQGQWNEDAGDLVAPILAQVLGREVRILEPAPQGGVYEINDNRIFRPQDPGLPAGRADTGQPPIHLFYNGAHYQHLESRNLETGSVGTWETEGPTGRELEAFGAESFDALVSGFIDNWDSRNSIQATNSGTPADLTKLHEHFGIDDLDTFSQEHWTNDDWGQSVFIQLSDNHKTQCINKDLLEFSFKDTKFGNAIGGNAEGHGSTLGEQRYIKVSSLSGNIYVLTNQGSENAANKLEIQVSDRANTSAAVLSLELQNSERIASVSTNSRGEDYIVIGSSMSHGQSEYPVYELVSHQQISIEQAEELARNGQSLFNNSDVNQSQPPVGSVELSARMDNSPEAARRPQERRGSPGLASSHHNQVPTPAALNEIRDTFTRAANNRDFGTLTQREQRAMVRLISRVTGYPETEIRATLTAGGNRSPRPRLARMNNSHQAARGPQEMGGSSPAGAMLGRRPNNPVRTQAERNDIRYAFMQANDRSFGALTPEEQTAEVRRISRATGHIPSGVMATLTGGWNRPTAEPRQPSARMDNSHEAVHRRQEVGGRSPSPARAMLSRRPNNQVRTPEDRNHILNAFTQTANGRNFGALTQEEQTAEVRRISRETGYLPTGVRTTLNAMENRHVRTLPARTEIRNAFIQANDRAFGALTQDEQDAEVTRISRATGYRPSGVRTTLNDVENRLSNAPSQPHFRPGSYSLHPSGLWAMQNFGANRPNRAPRQPSDRMDISHEAAHRPQEMGASRPVGHRQNNPVLRATARTEVRNAFNRANNRPFSALAQHEQDAEVRRISQATGYSATAVMDTLNDVENSPTNAPRQNG